ncbi:MAG: hypothetical protein ACI4E2_00185 [Acetatifactor sp.]
MRSIKQKIRKIKKQLFRNKEDYFLVIGFFVSIIVFLNVSIFLYRMNREREIYDFYDYSLKFIVTYQGTHNEELFSLTIHRLADELQSFDGCNVICEFPVPREDSLDTQIVNLIITKTEPVPFMKDNSYKDMKNGIAIGESLLERTGQKGSYIFLPLLGYEFPVMTVVDNKMSGGIDCSLYVFWDNLDKEVREAFLKCIAKNDFLTICLQSQNDLSHEYKKYMTLINSLGCLSDNIDSRSGENVENIWYRYYNSIFLSCGVAFSVFSSLITGIYWIQNAKKEIAIRRAIGFDWIQVSTFLMIRLVELGGIAFIFALLFESVYLVAIQEFFAFASFPLIVFWTVSMTSILIMLQTLSMVHHAKKQSVSIMLRKE